MGGISTEEIADANGMTNATFSYQRHRRFSDQLLEVVEKYNIAWYSHDAHLDSGWEISWKVIYTDDAGTKETVYSDWYLLFPAGMLVEAPHVTAPPSISAAGDDDVWSPGERVEIRLTFSERMTVLAVNRVNPGRHRGKTSEVSPGQQHGHAHFHLCLDPSRRLAQLDVGAAQQFGAQRWGYPQPGEQTGRRAHA